MNTNATRTETEDQRQTFAYPLSGEGSGAGVDEAYTATGDTRPHWKHLLQALHTMGDAALNDCQAKGNRLLRDDGATYKIYDQPDANQTWQLNAIPFVISSEEWATTEAMLIERAQVFNLLLQDIYGERKLISHNIIPPELVFSHQGFLRPCHNTLQSGAQQLILHSADIIRGPDGKHYVMADRTQAPSGAGYALENRRVMQRVFPGLIRDSHIQQLSSFFARLQQKLQALNPNGGTARIAVLTPGAYNETYFEHAYLANYFGFALVQGNDLCVRNGYLWMKTLDGLKRVDVILRRVDDIYCDPVELKGDSQLGVPGLLEVARLGHVAIANPLGSNFLENPALLRYLPEISRALIGRELLMPSVKTWWCGNNDDLDYVCANLKNLLIKPTYRKPGLYEVYGAELDDTKLQAWQNRIRKNPFQFVAQEYIPCSTTPSWHQERLQPSAAILRTFAIATDKGYEIMPGGLTRVNLDAHNKIISNQRGSISKDTWVIRSEPRQGVNSGNLELHVSHDNANELPSRVVENLFWMGRYAERAESALRLLRTLRQQLNGTQLLSRDVRNTLLRSLTHVTATYPGFCEFDEALFENPEPEILSLLTDLYRTGGVANNLASMIRASEQIKEQLSTDIQRVINTIGDQLNQLSQSLNNNEPAESEDIQTGLKTSLLALTGLIHNSMARDNGWHFMEMGRHLECALQTLGSLRALLTPAFDEDGQEVLVESALLASEALGNFRRTYQNGINIKNGLEMMLLNRQNPRSVIYQLTQLDMHFRNLPGAQSPLNVESKFLLEATTAIQLCDLNLLATTNGNMRESLDQLLARIQQLISNAASKISQRYFDHNQGSQLLANNNDWPEQ